MSLSMNGDELHRAHISDGFSAGGGKNDVQQLPATEDRMIEKVVLSDAGGGDSVGTELSFSSQRALATGGDDDAKSSTIAAGFDTVNVTDLGIEWSAGEELHLHGVNNSGASEQVFVTIYYREV